MNPGRRPRYFAILPGAVTSSASAKKPAWSLTRFLIRRLFGRGQARRARRRGRHEG
jgi:hypothetical protein